VFAPRPCFAGYSSGEFTATYRLIHTEEKRMLRRKRLIILLCALVVFVPGGRAQSNGETKQLAREILKQLIEINTTDSVGNVTTAAEAMAKRLRDAGFSEKDVIVAGPNERKKNLVARFRGTGKHKPVLFIGHLDVVEAKREDWTTDPFQFIEKDGYFYGRGTQDMKEGDAILVTNFMRLKKEGFVPDRDLIVALTADEEGGNYNGIEWLVKHHRDWIDAEYCINLDGLAESQKGRPSLFNIDVSEKVYADFTLETTNPGGHSSVPRHDNAIYSLAAALTRIQAFAFPLKLNDVSRKYLEYSARRAEGQRAADLLAVAKIPPDPQAVERLSEDPNYNSILRTTCVATMLSGGHAPNALPQAARANVNCRIFPGEEPEEVRQTLTRVIAEPQVSVRFVEQHAADGSVIIPVSVPPSTLNAELVDAVEKIITKMWPGVPVIADMSQGASDSTYLRIGGIPAYVFSGVFLDSDDVRAHGRDERIRTTSFYEGVEFNYQLIRELGSGRQSR
jgi:acetylornithine deacetylase/succinyl-diaminopimelate desuccinylase-like protein